MRIAPHFRRALSAGEAILLFLGDIGFFAARVAREIAYAIFLAMLMLAEVVSRPFRKRDPYARYATVGWRERRITFPVMHLPSPLTFVAGLMVMAYLQAPLVLAYAEDTVRVSAIPPEVARERALDLVFDYTAGPIKEWSFFQACKDAGIEDDRRCNFFWAVSWPESRRDRHALNVNMHQNSCGAGSVDAGVVQINISPACHQKRLQSTGDPFSLVPALRVANEILSIQGCRAWSTYDKLAQKDRYCDSGHVPIPLSRPRRHQVMAAN